jgi:hypothetical protein
MIHIHSQRLRLKASKHNTSRIVLIFLLLITSCGPEILFLKPLPKAKKNMASIPSNFCGRYISLTDSSILSITGYLVISDKTEYRQMTKEQLFAEIDTTIDHDTLVWITPGWNIEFRLFADSAKYISKQIDTLFSKTDESCIRKYRNILFLNVKNNHNYWSVQIMIRKNDSLFFGDLINTQEIDSIRNITRVKAISDSSGKIQEYYLNPSKRELNRILKRKKITPNYAKL